MRRLLDVRRLLHPILALALGAIPASRPAAATPAISMDVATGDVLYQQDATQPWYPASTTKLMTVYVALSAVRDHQIAMNTPLVVSARAHKMPPSKMGFAVGTQVTLDNALKMLMVRSANDVAITVAEGIAGSVEAFADDMNQAAASLGMRDSHFVNPNGLPAADHYSSARDMAILARALYAQFPDDTGLFNLGELALGAQRIGNHNNLLGRYPGADGMKTGFTCPAGFNVVASAFRDGRRVVVVVLGAPSVAARSQKVVALFDRAFAGVDRPIESIQAMPVTGGSPPDMRDRVCRARGPLLAQFNAEVEQLDQPLLSPVGGSGIGLSALAPERALLFSTPTPTPSEPWAMRISSMPQPIFDPVPVHIGADPGYSGLVAEARAPHSPIGTATPPVTANAYAAPVTPAGEDAPLPVDPTALPLRGRSGHMARIPRRGRVTMKAAAEAPKTKIIAGTEGEGGAEPPAEPARPAAHGRKGKAIADKPVGVKKAVAKKVEPKKAEARKAEPKKAEAKKAEPKKPEAKSAAPKPKKVARAKSKGDAAN